MWHFLYQSTAGFQNHPLSCCVKIRENSFSPFSKGQITCQECREMTPGCGWGAPVHALMQCNSHELVLIPAVAMCLYCPFLDPRNHSHMVSPRVCGLYCTRQNSEPRPGVPFICPKLDSWEGQNQPHAFPSRDWAKKGSSRMASGLQYWPLALLPGFPSWLFLPGKWAPQFPIKTSSSKGTPKIPLSSHLLSSECRHSTSKTLKA